MNRLLVTTAVALIALTDAAAAQSVLERVMAKVDGTNISPVNGTFANIAENVAILDADGNIAEVTQDRFALFLIEWLGGPADYSSQFGHPRLRMRHAHVPVDEKMRDAWVRCMKRALDDLGVSGDVRGFLDARFLEVADFLRNRT